MVPNELCLRALSLGWRYDSLIRGRNDTPELLNLGQKKHGSFCPRLPECFLRRKQAIVWDIWIPWNCPVRKFKLAMSSGHTSFSCSRHSRPGIRHIVKGAFKCSTLSLHWLQPQGRTVKLSSLSYKPNEITITHRWKLVCFQRICSAAIEKQESFSSLKAKEENWNTHLPSALLTLLSTSLFFSHLYGLYIHVVNGHGGAVDWWWAISIVDGFCFILLCYCSCPIYALIVNWFLSSTPIVSKHF